MGRKELRSGSVKFFICSNFLFATTFLFAATSLSAATFLLLLVSNFPFAAGVGSFLFTVTGQASVNASNLVLLTGTVITQEHNLRKYLSVWHKVNKDVATAPAPVL